MNSAVFFSVLKETTKAAVDYEYESSEWESDDEVMSAHLVVHTFITVLQKQLNTWMIVDMKHIM